MFLTALFTIAKTWKQSKCPSTDEWIKKIWYVYTMEYYSAIKQEWNNAICSNMDGPRDDHTGGISALKIQIFLRTFGIFEPQNHDILGLNLNSWFNMLLLFTDLLT